MQRSEAMDDRVLVLRGGAFNTKLVVLCVELAPLDAAQALVGCVEAALHLVQQPLDAEQASLVLFRRELRHRVVRGWRGRASGVVARLDRRKALEAVKAGPVKRAPRQCRKESAHRPHAEG